MSKRQLNILSANYVSQKIEFVIMKYKKYENNRTKPKTTNKIPELNFKCSGKYIRQSALN